MPFAQTNNIQTFYEINGEGSPIVLVHGGLVDHQIWQPQVEPFFKKYRIITYDIRGHGQTGGSEKRAYSVQLLAEDLRALLEQLQIDKPVVCGLSLGGIIAQAYAASYPADITAFGGYAARFAESGSGKNSNRGQNTKPLKQSLGGSGECRSHQDRAKTHVAQETPTALGSFKTRM